jgi:hypothetical protein
VKQPWRAYGLTTRGELQKQFVADQFHIRKLVGEIVVKAALQPATRATSAAP